MSEHVYVPLPDALGGMGAHALLSKDPDTRTAAVFVHGFSGHPLKTWVDFHGMVDSPGADPWWGHCDLYFFRYPSVEQSTAATAKKLIREVQSIFPNPDPRWFRVAVAGMPRDLEIFFAPNEISDIRPGSKMYEHLVLVGHSEGGFVLRRLVLRIFKDYGPADPLLQAKLRLFAPALFGAAPSGMLGAMAEFPGIRAISQVFLGSSVAYKELKSDSLILRQVESATKEVAAANPTLSAFKALVIWGENDQIVLQGEYSTDMAHALSPVPGHDHGSICKPNPAFVLPLEFIHA
jgi:pimeloyl-ACP methyl ester carboxylesterase